MWATRLRCPSEAAYPQVLPPPRFYPCRRATRPSASGCSLPDEDVGNYRNTSRNRCRPWPRGPGLAAVGVGLQMHFFVLDRAPQAFDEDVVHETTASVHRNRYAGGFELSGEGGAGELRALIGIEYFGLSVALQGFVQRVEAETRIHSIRQAPSEHRAASPIDDRHQIEMTARHRNIGDVGRPDVVRLGDRHAAQKIGIYLVSRRALARAGTRNQSLDPHHAHQPLHALAIDAATFLVELK